MSTITPAVLLDGAVASLDDVNGNFDQLTEINGKLETAISKLWATVMQGISVF